MMQEVSDISDCIMVTEENYKEIADIYNSMFSALRLINEESPSKLGIHNNKLYKSWSHLSGVQRAYYGESRKTLLDFLENKFSKYVQFYNNMFILLNTTNSNLMHEIATTVEVSKLNIALWINGLKCVSSAYPDDTEVHSKIQIIISMLTGILSKKVDR